MTRTLKLAGVGMFVAFLAGCDLPPPDPGLAQDEEQLDELGERRDHLR